MAIQGLRTSGNFATDERPKNWREGLLRLYPNGDTPLYALTSMMKSRAVDDPEYNWWEKELTERRLKVTASITASATALAVEGDAKTVTEGALLWIMETNEVVAVTADPSSDTALTVQRGYAGTTAASFDPTASGKNPYAIVIGTAFEEGSLAPTGVNFDPTKVFNYLQIFRNTLEMTRTGSKTKLRTTEQLKEARRECLELHSLDIERAFWFGQRFEGTKNGNPIRTTRGLMNFIPSSNVVDMTTTYSSGVSMANLEEELMKIFKYGSSEKMCFTGNRALLTIQQIVRKNSSIQIHSGIKEFGMNVTRLDCPFGSLVFKTHPLFNQMPGGVNTAAYYGLDSWVFILDMDKIKYVYMKGDDTRYEPDLTVPGMDGKKAGYLSEIGLEVHNPKAFYIMKRLQKAIADA